MRARCIESVVTQIREDCPLGDFVITLTMNWLLWQTDDAFALGSHPVEAPSAVLVDRHNNRRTIAARDGFYSRRIPGATNNVGWPVMAEAKAKAPLELELSVLDS